MRFRILKRDRYRCQLCGRSALEGVQIDIDHRIALSQGGTNEAENLWVLCGLSGHWTKTAVLDVPPTVHVFVIALRSPKTHAKPGNQFRRQRHSGTAVLARPRAERLVNSCSTPDAHQFTDCSHEIDSILSACDLPTPARLTDATWTRAIDWSSDIADARKSAQLQQRIFISRYTNSTWKLVRAV